MSGDRSPAGVLRIGRLLRPRQERPDPGPLARFIGHPAGPHSRPGSLFIEGRCRRQLARQGRFLVSNHRAVVAVVGVLPRHLAMIGGVSPMGVGKLVGEREAQARKFAGCPPKQKERP